MIPIRDDNPVRGLPVATPLLILTCMGVYLWLLSLSPEARVEATTLLGFMPGVLFGYGSIGKLDPIYVEVTVHDALRQILPHLHHGRTVTSDVNIVAKMIADARMGPIAPASTLSHDSYTVK